MMKRLKINKSQSEARARKPATKLARTDPKPQHMHAWKPKISASFTLGQYT
jgi:hypothetical protein